MIVEPSGSGHHMALYVRHVARKFVDSGITLSLLTTYSAVAHPSYELVNAEVGSKVKLFFLPELPKSNSSSSLALLINQIKAWLILRREFRKIKKVLRLDIVYVPTLDWIAKATELLGSPFGVTPFVALYMSPKHHRKAMGLGPASRHDWFYHILFQRLLGIKTLRGILVVDEFFFEYCQKHYPRLSQKVKYIPDFGEVRGSGTKKGCKIALGIGLDKKVILVYGSLTKRKGIAQLLDSMLDSDVPEEVILLLAGKADEEIVALIKTKTIDQLVKTGRIITRFYFHTEKEEYLAFMASDYAWLGYVSGFCASSGVLYQSASIGLPVIAIRDGLIGQIVKRYSLGDFVDPCDTKSIVSFLCQAVVREGVIEGSSDIKLFSQQHTAECHASSVLAAIKSYDLAGHHIASLGS